MPAGANGIGAAPIQKNQIRLKRDFRHWLVHVVVMKYELYHLLSPMFIQDSCLTVRFGSTGFKKSSMVTATRALILDDTVLKHINHT